MKNLLILGLTVLFIGSSISGIAQRRKKNDKDTATAAVKADTAAVAVKADTAAIVPAVPVTVKDSTEEKKDTIEAVAKPDTAVVVTPKDCFQAWYEKMRARGANTVTDGMHPVVITLKSETSGLCMMGKAQVTGGKIVPPLMIQQEDGEYKAANLLGKKLDPAFAGSMSEDQLYGITDGMSILFRTSNQEYGRILFYTFAKKGPNANKVAPSPDELIKD